MKTKGGKIVGLNEKGEEVDVYDPSAKQWFDTNKYTTLSKDQAIAMSRPSTPVGARRKTRRGKKNRRRRTTRKR